jgi:putative endonuclease
MFYYVYILKSKRDNHIYAGYTKDLRKRLEKHNQGQVEATKNRRPFTLIYYEAYLHQQDATKREKYFKTGWGRTYLKKVLNNYFKILEL